MSNLELSNDDILARLVAIAVEHDADGLEIEYDDGYEEVCAIKGSFGVGIARLDSSGEESRLLRDQLNAIKRKGIKVNINDATFRLKVSTYYTFGEWAYRVKIQAEQKNKVQ